MSTYIFIMPNLFNSDNSLMYRTYYYAGLGKIIIKTKFYLEWQSPLQLRFLLETKLPHDKQNYSNNNNFFCKRYRHNQDSSLQCPLSSGNFITNLLQSTLRHRCWGTAFECAGCIRFLTKKFHVSDGPLRISVFL